MNRLHLIIAGGITSLLLLTTAGPSAAANAAGTAPTSSSAMSVEEEIASNCTTRSFDYTDVAGYPPVPKDYRRVELYCVKTPPDGWKVRGVLDVVSGTDEHTPWIRSTDSALLHQWQIGGGLDRNNTSDRGTRLEIVED